MKSRRFTEVEIVLALIERRNGTGVAGLCRTQKISRSTYYRWEARHAGLSVCELGNVLALERENTRLKRRFNRLVLDNALIKTALERSK